jgi:thioesterase domain-containing protein
VLVEFVEKKMQETDNVELIFVDTPKTNTVAIRFLEQLGFSNPTEQVYLSYSLPPLKQKSKKRKAENELELSQAAKQLKQTENSSVALSISTVNLASGNSTTSNTNSTISNHNNNSSSSNETEVANETNQSSSNNNYNNNNNNLGVNHLMMINNQHHSQNNDLINNNSVTQKQNECSTLPTTTAAATPIVDDIVIRPMGLDDIWPVVQVGEMAFTFHRPNLYRLWDEVRFISKNN